MILLLQMKNMKKVEVMKRDNALEILSKALEYCDEISVEEFEEAYIKWAGDSFGG